MQSKVVLDIPEGINFKHEGQNAIVSGPKGEIKRKLFHPRVRIMQKENKITFHAEKISKKEKCLIGTLSKHIGNMFKGVNEEFVYKLKICSGHFPMTVAKEGDNIVIKNFLGEKVPRKSRIMEDVKVEIKGDEIIVNSINKEFAGQTAANIEQSTRITNKDRRKFQDGCYITVKAGKEV